MSTAAKQTSSDSTETVRHPWRENVEALVVAIAVALLFKYFVLEISKIPSGSMQPTLMGNPETAVFDRVLVDKLSMRMRDPKRFEIVVFKHPIENSRIMVKRLIGMPDEWLRIKSGDLWTRSNEDEDWTILRRPDAVQETAWRAIDVDEPQASSWRQILGERNWRLDGRDVDAPGPGGIRYGPRDGPIRDGYTDGYPDALRGGIQPQDPRMKRGTSSVGDLRVRSEIAARPELEFFVVRLTEDVFAYEFTIPGPAAKEGARPSIEVRENGSFVTRVEAQEDYRLRAGRDTDFAAWNLDDRLGLKVGKEELLSLDVAEVANQSSAVILELKQGGAEFEDLLVERDIHYLSPRGERVWTVEIPSGHYVVLGDNTQDSADSRDWQAQRWTLPDRDGEPIEVTGNFRNGNENPTRVQGLDGRKWTRFRDRYGEVHWFPSDTGEEGLPYADKLVPRELIQGRAVATFWPLKPWKGIWRLGWLH